MNNRIVFSLIFLHALIQMSVAQNTELKFHTINGPDGKPLGKIRNITQDPHGYMWFSGEGEKCIYRYDGIRITVFKHEASNPNSLGGRGINSVYADGSGIIWIGMGEGLDRFDPATGEFQHFHHDPNDAGSLSGNVTPVLKDRKGRLWVGTDDGLDLMDEKTEKFIHYRNEPGNPRSLSSNVVWNIYEDRQGVLWIATGFPFYNKDEKDQQDGGLNRLEPDGTFTQFKHDPNDPHSLISNKVRAMFEDSRGVFWVGTSGDGLHTLDRKTGRFERHTYDPSKPDKLSRPPLKVDNDFAFNNDQIAFIQEDVVGSIWIGTLWSGLNRYDTLTKKVTRYDASNGFPDNSGWNAFQSRDGELWISTQEDHLYRTDPFKKSINNIPTRDQVTRFLEDKKGNMWAGSYEGGLLQYDREENFLRQFKHDASDPFSLFDKRNITLTLFQNQEDTLWVGTSEGLGILNTSTNHFSRINLDIKANPESERRPVTKIIQDRQHTKWIAAWAEGLVSLDSKGTIKQYMHDKKDSASIGLELAISVLEDKSGTIWVSGNSGIDRLDNKTAKFHHYMKGVNVPTLFEDSGGTILAGTESGLFEYNQKEDNFIRFLDPQSPLAALPIHTIVEDDAKRIWLHSPSAIIKLDPVTKETYVYDNRFGIMYNSLWPNAGYKNSKGKLFVGYHEGFYSFYPEELDIPVQPLNITITDILINNLPLPQSLSSFQQSIETASSLIMQSRQNNISFNFAAIDYRSPETVKYFTRLDGYDSIWREARGEKSANYFSLPTGEFTFRVKAYNLDGTMGEKIITIHILPPWWQTWWAYVSYIVLAGFAIFGFIRLRTRSLQQDKVRLEEKVNVRTAELNTSLQNLKATQNQLIQSEKMASLGELTAGIAHEIQNPLNFVNNFSEVNKELLLEMKEEMEKGNLDNARTLANDVIENQEKINHHGKRADGIVKGMLQHSRSSSGTKEPTNINSLADEYLRLAYHGLRAKDKSFNATLKTDFDETIGTLNIVPQDIGRVILNLINNAFYAISERKKSIDQSGFKNLTGLAGQAGYEPTVTVSTKKSNNKVLISVKDNGNGIPQKVLDKIFQPFFTTKPTGQGTGLGLSLSYDIVKAHGGELNLETKEGEGSEFIVTLSIV